MLCEQCNGQLWKGRAEMSCLKPDGKGTREIWLCGRKQCDNDYENRVKPKVTQ